MATATFDDILSAQRETNELLGKQRNPLDGRTGAGKALLDASREQLDRQSETTSAIHDLHVATAGYIDDPKQPSASQIEETNKDRNNQQNKRFGALGKIFKTQIGKLTTAFSNLNKAAKGGIIAALSALGLFALADFLESETFEKIRVIVVEKLPPLLDRIYKNILKPVLDFFVPKFQKLFGDLLDFLEDPTLEGLGKLIMDNKIAVASLAVLLAPKLFLKGLKAAFFLGKKSLKFAMTALTTDLGKVATDLKTVSTNMKKKAGVQLGKMKLAAKSLVASTTAILAPIATTAAVFAGAVGLFLGLFNAVEILASDIKDGNLTFGTIGRMFKGFLEGLAEIPTIIGEMIIPEDIREKVMVGIGDFVDDAVKGIKEIGKFIDENFIEPFGVGFDRIGKDVKAGIKKVGDFFDDILAPFQRAVRAFKETDGFFTKKIGAAMDAFGDPNFFGEPPPSTMGETYGFAGDRMPRTELMQMMTGNLNTRTGQRFADASLDKAGRDAAANVLITNVNNVDNSTGKGATSNSFPGSRIVDPQDPNRNV